MKKILIFVLSLFIQLNFLSAEITLEASKADYFDSNILTDNNYSKLDIYPIKLSWTTTPNKNSKTFEIFFSENKNGPFNKIGTVASTEKNEYYHINNNAKPGTKYYYKITSLDINSNLIDESNISEGWGALSYEVYFMLYNKIITISHNKLVLMNKKKTLEKLGEEKISGDKSGSLEYKTAVKGLGGLVTMVYENYSDNSDWIINGSMNTKANMSANGTMYGTIEINGMYPGKIFYDNVILKDGKAGGGTYDVQPKGINLKQLEYTIIFKNFDDLY